MGQIITNVWCESVYVAMVEGTSNRLQRDINNFSAPTLQKSARPFSCCRSV